MRVSTRALTVSHPRPRSCRRPFTTASRDIPAHSASSCWLMRSEEHTSELQSLPTRRSSDLGEPSSVDSQPSETPELPQALHDSLSGHSCPLGQLLLVDGSVDLHMVAERPTVAFGELRQAHAQTAERVDRTELDLSQGGIPEPGDDQLQKLTRHSGMLIEEFVKVGIARDVDLDGLEGDDCRRTRPAIDGTHLTQQTSPVENRQDDFAAAATSTDLDAADTEHAGFAPGVALAEDDRPFGERLSPAAGLEALGLRVRQPAEEVTFSRIGRGHSGSAGEVRPARTRWL